MAESTSPRLLWRHPSPESTQIYKFMQKANATNGLSMQSFQDLYKWSTEDSTRCDFWSMFLTWSGIIYEGSYSKVVDLTARMDSIPRWFEGTRLNFAENMLFERGSNGTGDAVIGQAKHDDKVAVTEVREGCRPDEIRNVTWRELREKVGILSNAMRARGVRRGDRVALIASNSVDTLVTFLSVTAIGGLFSSASTDMGLKGILDRLLQSNLKWVFMDDWAVYNGKTTDLRPKIADVVEGLKDVTEFQGIVTQPRFPTKPASVEGMVKTMTLSEFVKAGQGKSDLRFERVEFSDPFLIVWSSGTTGPPKSIVHSVGGLLCSAFKVSEMRY